MVVRAAERFVSSAPGRISRHVFSFAEHYDPARIGFGSLMVCNTDLVEVDHGYPDHPHRDAEIITWVLSGSLRHADSFGNVGIVHPGLAQRMSAGSGIVHAELNDAYRLDPRRPAQAVHFVQMWLRPDQPGSTPGYAQRALPMIDLDGDLVPVAAGANRDAAIDIGNRGATLWATRLAPGITRRLPEAGLLFVVVAAGEVEIEGPGLLHAGDTAQLTGRGGSTITGRAEAELLIWELG